MKFVDNTIPIPSVQDYESLKIGLNAAHELCAMLRATMKADAQQALKDIEAARKDERARTERDIAAHYQGIIGEHYKMDPDDRAMWSDALVHRHVGAIEAYGAVVIEVSESKYRRLPEDPAA